MSSCFSTPVAFARFTGFKQGSDKPTLAMSVTILGPQTHLGVRTPLCVVHESLAKDPASSQYGDSGGNGDQASGCVKYTPEIKTKNKRQSTFRRQITTKNEVEV